MAAPERASPQTAAILALVANAFVWGVSWWPFRELQDRGVHPLWATAAVYVTSLVVVVLAWPRALGALRRFGPLWLLLAAAGVTNVGFNWAVTVGDVVRVVLLFYLMPAWSVLLAWPLLGERPTGPALLRLVLALAGVVVILKRPEVPWPLPETLADGLALLGGFSFALTNILLRRLQHEAAVSRVAAMFAGGALAALGAGAVALSQGLATAPAWPGGVGLAWAAALSVGFLLGNAALQYGASRLPAQTTALVMLSEVLFASATAVAAGAAELGPRVWAGGALIVLAAAWSAWAAPASAAPQPAQSRP